MSITAELMTIPSVLPGRAVRPARVLLVDDEPEHAEIVAAILTRDGYEVRVAGDGRQGLELALAERPDLVLLDLYMPLVDGFTTAERLRRDARTSDVPILFLSAAGDLAGRARSLNLTGVDYLAKPFHAAELLARVERLQPPSADLRD